MIRIICPKCADVVEHHCHTDLHEAIVSLLTWIPNGGPATPMLAQHLVQAGVEYGWIEPGDKTSPEERFDAPFFGSQVWSYLLLGSKDEARSFHARIHAVCRAANVDYDHVMEEFNRKRDAAMKAAEEREVRGKERRDERAGVVVYLQDEDILLEERIAKLDELIKRQAALRKLVPFSTNEFGFSPYLHRWLATYYSGGLGEEINRARVSKLEQKAYDDLNKADR